MRAATDVFGGGDEEWGIILGMRRAEIKPARSSGDTIKIIMTFFSLVCPRVSYLVFHIRFRGRKEQSSKTCCTCLPIGFGTNNVDTFVLKYIFPLRKISRNGMMKQ